MPAALSLFAFINILKLIKEYIAGIFFNCFIFKMQQNYFPPQQPVTDSLTSRDLGSYTDSSFSLSHSYSSSRCYPLSQHQKTKSLTTSTNNSVYLHSQNNLKNQANENLLAKYSSKRSMHMKENKTPVREESSKVRDSSQ